MRTIPDDGDMAGALDAQSRVPRPLRWLVVVVDGDAQEAGDIEDAVGGVRPVAGPAGVVERRGS